MAASQAGKWLATWVLCVAPALGATSHQYTWSLLIFIAPICFAGHSLHQRGLLRPMLAPIGASLALLVPMGAVLTVGLADDFFTYPAASATLGLTFPAVDLSGVDHSFQVPVEELAFYVLGFTSLLLVYTWADQVLLSAPRAMQRAARVSLSQWLLALGSGVALAAAGWALQRVLNPGAVMPGYWVYLMLVPVPVMVALGPAMASRINWPALVLLCLALWGHSVLWEVTLAVPQGWWGYQRQSMVGLEISAWHRLPVEAVLVWLITPLATVISFEAICAHLATPRRTP